MCVSLLAGLDHGDDRVENVGLVRLHYVATHYHLVYDKMSFLYVKHYLEQRRHNVRTGTDGEERNMICDQ